jgi:hypothetical protein
VDGRHCGHRPHEVVPCRMEPRLRVRHVREKPRSMHDREDVYALTTHEIDDSIPAHENLPDFSPFIIGNESSDARELLSLTGGFEDGIGEQTDQPDGNHAR